MKLDVSVWMNIPSFYQIDLFNRLAERDDVDLRVRFARRLDATRRALGWDVDRMAYAAEVLEGAAGVARCLRRAWGERGRVHVVNGLWSEPKFMVALAELAAAGAPIVVYGEAQNRSRPRPGWKTAAQRSFAKYFSRRVVGVLAVSRLAEDFYVSLGFPPDCIYPFAYFRDGPGDVSTASWSRPEFVYVGRLAQVKGVDVLLHAMASLAASAPEARLTIVGDGPESGALRALASALRLGERVSFVGTASPAVVRRYMDGAAALVLPSRHDGWGLVVNEALSMGIPVVVTDRCGASDVVRPDWNGFVVPADDVTALHDALSAIVRQTLGERARMRERALVVAECLEASRAADYLVACLRHMLHRREEARPEPPWRLALCGAGADANLLHH